VDRRQALRALPTGYALALTLREEGHDEPTIAERLGFAPESVGTLLALAEAKLARVMAQADPDGP
jgi:hypothetical protein